MTPDEKNMLNDLADKIAQTPAAPRDPEAEDIVRSKIGKRPDALYLMTQTVLIQNLALQRAQQQLQSLQRGGQTPAGGSSWLGQGSPNYSGGGNQPQYAAAPSYAQPASVGGGGSSFLRGAAQTAAGVAAGTLAAEAIGSMFSHGGGMFGGGSNFIGGTGAPTEEIVNNYYDSPGGSDAGGGQGSNFVDPGDDNYSSQDDSSQFDDNNSMMDDTSGFDSGDGGGFDDNLV